MVLGLYEHEQAQWTIPVAKEAMMLQVGIIAELFLFLNRPYVEFDVIK